MDFNYGIPFGSKLIKGANSFLNPEDAYKRAREESSKYYNEGQNYLRPYNEHGLDQYGRLNTAENRLLNPGDLENEWASGYQTSPYAKQLLEQNKTSGLDAASSMGLMGSSAAVNNIQTGAGNIVNQDRQQYMQDLMQKYLAGIGLGQNIYGQGANAGNNMSNNAMHQGENQAGLAYKEAAAPGEMFGKLLGMGIDAAGNYATGGAYGAAKGATGNRLNTGTGGGYTG